MPTPNFARHVVACVSLLICLLTSQVVALCDVDLRHDRMHADEVGHGHGDRPDLDDTAGTAHFHGESSSSTIALIAGNSGMPVLDPKLAPKPSVLIPLPSPYLDGRLRPPRLSA